MNKEIAYFLLYLQLFLGIIFIIGSNKTYAQTKKVDLLKKSVWCTDQFSLQYQLNKVSTKQVILTVYSDSAYSNLSVYVNDKLKVDNLDIPNTGKFTYEVLLNFESIGLQNIILKVKGSPLKILTFSIQDTYTAKLPRPIFKDVSSMINFDTEYTLKYGGPSVADINNDGYYDFVLNNHDKVLAKLFWNNGDRTVKEHSEALHRWDVHGSAVADYDNDGDLDIIIAQGGGNGTNPQPLHLLRNENNQEFIRISDSVGITKEARGRSVRWIDFDLNNKLDLFVVNAGSIHDNNTPRHLIYKNLGNHKFQLVRSKNIEDADAERLLVTDINNDGNADCIMFYPQLSIWLGNADFSFREVTDQYIGEKMPRDFVMAVADLDIDNDGDMDFYISRGKTYYEIANKSLDFDRNTKRLDIREEGSKGRRSLSFKANRDIIISGMFNWFRGYEGGFPVYVGEEKKEFKPKYNSLKLSPNDAKGWPKIRTKNGWYLGNNQWKCEWVKDDNIYWGIRISLSGVDSVTPDFIPNNRNKQDILLRNDGDRFTDVSEKWKIPLGGNHQGVTTGDFNNDGYQDIFVYRFGYLKSCVADWLLINNGKGGFEKTTCHGAHDINDEGHGDMGQAFDFDLDGRLDLLNGSDNPGKWYLYKNNTESSNAYSLVRVGYSPKENVDLLFTKITLETENGRYTKLIGSSGEVHSQGLLNIVHFGLGNVKNIKKIQITWRNGEQLTVSDQKINSLLKVGKNISNSSIKL